jgi:hypothetical protein
MAQGRKTGGRQKGSVNKRTRDQQEAIERASEAIAAAIPGAFEGDAHALLMMVYKDPSLDLDTRIDAAGKAIRFEKPMLSAIEAKVTQKFEGLSREQLIEEIAVRARRVGLSGDSSGPH